MSDLPTSGPSLRMISMIVYGLFALGFVTSGLFTFATLAAVIIMYVKRADAAGTLYATHFDWLINTFLWSLLWLALSFLTMFIGIGWLGLIATVVWVLYRLIKGFLLLLDGKPIVV
ncbi:DUF4870 family protein [Orrella daihaiensis]|uniref:Transmembrane protein n=1 Tax=Orrella daihaiensis TaxID=2782176 RepID=A0ABY4AKX0_9BURK|nr:hypothetical protein [Orrella daihaiensis]UOD50829.1 hypothetical protein DHf2319_02580 [Orrella daihaiensis]